MGPKGFIPVTSPGGNVPCRLYSIDSSATGPFYIGDLVLRENDGALAKCTAGAGNYILGAIVALYDSDMVPASSIATTTAAFALVADDVDQHFVAQDDGDTTQLSSADRGAGAQFIASAGSSTTGYRSGDEIDSSTATTTTNSQLRLVDIHDVEGNTYGANCKWIVKINCHQANQGIIGTAV